MTGAVLDVIVDIRKGSPTYGQWEGVYFIGKQPSSIVGAKRICPWLCYIDTECQLLYKCDNYYNAQADAGIAFDDPDLAIDWPIAKEQAILSEKDQHHPTLQAFEAENPFVYGEI